MLEIKQKQTATNREKKEEINEMKKGSHQEARSLSSSLPKLIPDLKQWS